MAKQSDITGFTVQTVSTDPAASAAATGAWASGGNMNVTRDQTMNGIQTVDMKAKGGRVGLKSGSKGCKLAMKGKGRAYGKNS